MLTCETPCSSVGWAGSLDGELLAELGHTTKIRPLKDLLCGQPDEAELPRSLDLVLIQGTVDELDGTSHWLSRVNRALAFGGLLIVNVKATSSGVRHPLQQIEPGTRLLAEYGFRVDYATNVALPDLGETDLTRAATSDERCWRALKVSEFIATDMQRASAIEPFAVAGTP